MRRHRDGETRRLGRLEQALDIGDGVVALDAGADDAPGHAIGAEKVVLRVGDDKGSAAEVELHVAGRQGGLCRGGVGIVLRPRAGGGEGGGGGGERDRAGQGLTAGDAGIVRMVVGVAIAHGMLLASVCFTADR